MELKNHRLDVRAYKILHLLDHMDTLSQLFRGSSLASSSGVHVLRYTQLSQVRHPKVIISNLYKLTGHLYFQTLDYLLA